MANLKISQLTAIVNAALEDLAAVVDDPSGTPATRKATLQQALDAFAGLATGFTIADADLFAVNDDTDGITKGISLANLRTALEAGLLPDEGENWKIIRADSPNAVTNGTTLINEYVTASGQTPYGSALAKTNPYFLILMPGTYDLDTTGLVMDTQWVHLVGIGGPQTFVKYRQGGNANPEGFGGGVRITSSVVTIDKTARDVAIHNLYIHTSHSTEPAYRWVAADDNQINVNCVFEGGGGINAMVSGVACNGYWQDCTAIGGQSFGGGASGTASGVFVRCTIYAQGGQAYGTGFGRSADASGTFVDCFAAPGSYGWSADASGTFLRCVSFGSSTTGSFGSRGTASGSFLWCRAQNDSFAGADFGSSHAATGFFAYCTADGDSFGGGNNSGDATGTFLFCESGDNSFGTNGGTVNGTFDYCVAGDSSFGAGSSGVFSGNANRCKAGANSFGGSGGTMSGVCDYCEGGNLSFGGGGGTLSGVCNWCLGGDGSFAGHSTANGGTLSGICHHCIGADGSFAGSSFATGNGGTISGQCNYCAGDEFCFGGSNGGTGGTISGRLIKCLATEHSYGSCNGGTRGSITATGLVEGCTSTGQWDVTIAGQVRYCDITAIGTDEDGITDLAAGATIAHCTVRATGTGTSINAAGAITASIFLTAVNTNLSANITNDISTPYVVNDANV